MKLILKKSLIIAIITMVISSAIAENYGNDWFIVKDGKKTSTAGITALNTFDDGMAAYAGDENGAIWMVNSSGSTKITNGPTYGRISGIAATKGWRNLGEFVIAQNGNIYSYNNGRFNKLADSGTTATEVISLSFSTRNGLFILSKDSDNHMYLVKKFKGDKWENLHELPLKITSDYYFGGALNTPASGLMLWFCNLNDHTGNKYIVVKYDESYKNWLFSDMKTYDSQDVSRFSYKNNGDILFNYMVNYLSYQILRANAEYVSEALDKKGDAIYRITISGAGINTEDAFRKGINGWSYHLSTDGSYSAESYPITGFRYVDNRNNACVIYPRDVTFYYLAKKGGNLRIDQNTYALGSEINKTASMQLALPDPPAWDPIDKNMTIEIKGCEEGGKLQNYGTGTCAIPFRVILKKSDTGAIVNPYDEAYDHIVFYGSYIAGSSINPNDLLGSSPYTSESGTTSIAILDSSSVEIDGMVKYGKLPTYSPQSGKTFYSFQDKDSKSSTLNAVLVHSNNTTGGQQQSFDVNDPVLAYPQVSGDPRGDYSDVKLNESGVPLRVSNYQDDPNGNYGGYIDYLIGDNRNKLKNGVYCILPQGLNNQTLTERLVLNKLDYGLYASPSSDLGTSCLQSDFYKISNRAVYSTKFYDKGSVSAYLFDCYGRSVVYTLTIDARESAEVKTRLSHDKEDKLNAFMKLTAGNIAPYAQFAGIPILVSVKTDRIPANLGFPNNFKGVFLPPNQIATFVSDRAAENKSDESNATYHFYGNTLTSNSEKDEIFHSLIQNVYPRDTYVNKYASGSYFEPISLERQSDLDAMVIVNDLNIYVHTSRDTRFLGLNVFYTDHTTAEYYSNLDAYHTEISRGLYVNVNDGHYDAEFSQLLNEAHIFGEKFRLNNSGSDNHIDLNERELYKSEKLNFLPKYSPCFFPLYLLPFIKEPEIYLPQMNDTRAGLLKFVSQCEIDDPNIYIAPQDKSGVKIEFIKGKRFLNFYPSVYLEEEVLLKYRDPKTLNECYFWLNCLNKYRYIQEGICIRPAMMGQRCGAWFIGEYQQQDLLLTGHYGAGNVFASLRVERDGTTKLQIINLE